MISELFDVIETGKRYEQIKTDKLYTDVKSIKKGRTSEIEKEFIGIRSKIQTKGFYKEIIRFNSKDKIIDLFMKLIEENLTDEEVKKYIWNSNEKTSKF